MAESRRLAAITVVIDVAREAFWPAALKCTLSCLASDDGAGCELCLGAGEL